jgi:hypothetical protein
LEWCRWLSERRKAPNYLLRFWRIHAITDGRKRARHQFAAWPRPLGTRENDFIWGARRHLPGRVTLEKDDIAWVIDLVAILITSAELLPQHLIKFMHATHSGINCVRCVKSGHS